MALMPQLSMLVTFSVTFNQRQPISDAKNVNSRGTDRVYSNVAGLVLVAIWGPCPFVRKPQVDFEASPPLVFYDCRYLLMTFDEKDVCRLQ